MKFIVDYLKAWFVVPAMLLGVGILFLLAFWPAILAVNTIEDLNTAVAVGALASMCNIGALMVALDK